MVPVGCCGWSGETRSWKICSVLTNAFDDDIFYLKNLTIS